MSDRTHVEPTIPSGTYRSFPLGHVVVYVMSTGAYFTLGAAGIALSGRSFVTIVLGIAYGLFAFAQTYGYMPLAVCPHCMYTRMGDGRCASGMDCVSRRLREPRDVEGLMAREHARPSHNAVVQATLVLPIVVMLVGITYAPSLALAATFVLVVGLLAFRIHFVMPRLACARCASKRVCPNAANMGVAD